MGVEEMSLCSPGQRPRAPSYIVEAFEKIQLVGPESTTPLVIREARQRKQRGIIQCQGGTSRSFPES